MATLGSRQLVGRAGLTRRAFLGGLAAGGTGVLLAGCGSDESSGGSSGGAPGSTQVTFLTVTPISLSFTPEIIADVGGHFADNGLEVTLEATRGSAQAIQTVLAGGALLTRIGDIETMIAIAEQDAPLVNIGMLIKNSTLRFVSGKSDPLQEPADWEGKLMGVPSEGGTSETTLDLVLAAGGVPLDSVERQVVGLAPGTFDLVKQGRIAGYVVGTDVAIQLQQQDPDVVVFKPGEVITSGGQHYATSQEQLESERDTLQAYMTAIRAAVDFVLADEELDETLELMRSKYDFETLGNEDVAKESLRQYKESWTLGEGAENPLLTSADRWNQAYEELVGAGQINEGLDPSQWITNELVE